MYLMNVRIQPILKCAKIATLTLLAYTASVQAAPISPDEAVVNANKFLNQTHRAFKKGVAEVRLQNVYTAKTDNNINAFYVLADNDHNVFTIVSADTRVPMVLAYSDTSGFDITNIPCNICWWLNEYAAQIGAFLDTNPAEEPATRAIVTDDDRQAVLPLVKTEWNQMAPYYNLCPIENGQRSVTGCVATAMAQVMKYHNWPPRGTGVRNDYSFERAYDWDNMIDNYEQQKYTDAQANAVATLMVSCGKSVDMEYSPYASGAMAYKLQNALPTYFDYTKEVRHLMREYYSQTQWDEIMYQEVYAGRPVIYGGSSSEGGHSFVCDGYSEDGFFHINWGWGGMSDGYFRLNALNPSQQGTGGFEGGYNSNQTALIHIEKNNGKGEMQVQLVANGPFIYQEPYFRVEGSGYNPGLVYNCLEQTIYVEAGLRVADESGETITYVTDPEGTDLEGYYGFEGFSVDMPQLPDGVYHLYPVFKTPDTDFLPVLVPYGVQQYVQMTVIDGKITYQNTGAPESMSTQLVTSDLIFSPYPSANCKASVRFYLCNVGASDYDGTVNVVLSDSSGAEKLSVPIRGSVAVGKSEMLSALVDLNNVSAGDYILSAYDNQRNLISDSYTVTIGGTLKPSSSTPLHFDILGPVYVQGAANTLNTIIYNESSSVQPVNLKVRLLSADGKDVISVLNYAEMNVPGNYRGSFTLSGISAFSTEGDWMIDVADDSGKSLATPIPVTVQGATFEIDKVNLSMTSMTNATVQHPQAGEYAGSVDVINDEFFYTVTNVDGNAFTFATTLTDVHFPETVNSIGAATFYCAKELDMLTFDATTPGRFSETAMPADRFGEVVLNVPMVSANIFKRTKGWSKLNVPGWNFDIDNTVSVLSDMQKDQNDAIYQPYYIQADKPLSLSLQVPVQKVLKVTITTPNGETTESYSSNGLITLPAIHKGVGTLKVEAVAGDSVDSILDYTVSDVYDLQGRLLKENADVDYLQTLSPGIYIFAGKTIILQ